MASKDRPPFEADIEALSHDGRGIARVDGKVWFIDGALPGEHVTARGLKGRRNYGIGVLEVIAQPSEQREEPRCKVFGICGGCALQHLNYKAQLDFKAQVIKDAFFKSRITELPDLERISAEPWHYRRRARLGVRYVPQKGGVLVGFRERNKSYVTPLTECPVIAPQVDRLLPHLAPLIEGLSIRDRLPQIEIAVGENATALVFRHLEPLSSEDLVKLQHFSGAHGVQVLTQSKGPETILPLVGSAHDPLEYRLPDFDIRMQFTPTSFIQINADINAALVSRVMNWLELDADDQVLDLFCGLGNFALAAARRAERVVGVEGESNLVTQAAENATRNGLVNAQFECRDLFDDSVSTWSPGLFSKVIVDPPRSGAMEALKSVASRIGPKMIAYVSCNPATLARDAEYLVNQGGYRISRMAMADMFPHTAHVETIALFERMA